MVDEKIKLLPRWTRIENFINLIGSNITKNLSIWLYYSFQYSEYVTTHAHICQLKFSTKSTTSIKNKHSNLLTCDIFIYFNNIKCPFPKYGVRKTNEIEGTIHVRYTSHIDDENKVTSYLKGL